MKHNGALTIDKVPGGKYTCQDNGDGTWNILDVAIMGEMFEGEKGVPFDLGKTWHEAALLKAEQRADGGHWGSVHINHHERNKNTERAGFLRLRRVGSMTYEGRESSCLYADLLRVPKRIFDLIDRAELPYMSVEVASWEEPEIASLALMPDETPFFRAPMLTTGEKLKANEPVRCSSLPAVAYASANQGGFILFKLGGIMLKKDAAPDNTEKKVEESKKLSLKERLAALLKANPDATDADISKVVSEKIDTEGLPGEEDDLEKGRFANEPVEQGDDKKSEEGAEERPSKSVQREDAREVARLSAKVDNLTKESEDRKKADKIKALLDRAHKDLKNRYLSADTEAKLRKAAERDITGETLRDFVEMYLKTVPPDELPEDSEAGADRRFGADLVSSEEPEAVAKFASKGPDSHAKARLMAKEYQLGVDSGHIRGLSLESFLDINFALPPVVRGRK